MEVDIEHSKGRPTRVSLTIVVLVQLIMGAVTFGSSFAMLRGQIARQSEQIEYLNRQRSEDAVFQRQVLDRMARLEERLDAVRDDIKRRR